MYGLFGVVLVCVLGVLLVRKLRTRVPVDAATRLSPFLARHTQVRIFIGLPLETPARWAPLVGVDARSGLLLLGARRVALAQVQAFLVATKSGEVIASLHPFAPLPKGLTLDDDDLVLPRAALTRAMLADDAPVRVTFTRDPTRPRGAIHVENASADPVIVLQYGSYQPDGARFTLSTTTGQFFTRDDFYHWFHLTREALAPGQQVTDPHAPWTPGRLWAFFCRAADGTEFIVGAVMGEE